MLRPRQAAQPPISRALQELPGLVRFRESRAVQSLGFRNPKA